MTYRKAACLLVGAVVLTLAACTSGDEPVGGSAAVAIKDFGFRPPDITAGAGQPIVWTNNDGVTHTVTFDSGEFNQTLPPGGEDSALPDPGTYSYHCSIHPTMTGTITVQG